jgi:phage terminase small subunit
VIKFLHRFNETGARGDSAIFAGYNERSGHTAANRLLGRKDVKAMLQTEIDARVKAARISRAKVLAALGEIAFSDISQVLDEDGRLLPARRWPKEARSAVQGVEVIEQEDGTVRKRVRMHSKVEPIADSGRGHRRPRPG